MTKAEQNKVIDAWVKVKMLLGSFGDDVEELNFPKGRVNFQRMKATEAYIILDKLVCQMRSKRQRRL